MRACLTAILWLLAAAAFAQPAAPRIGQEGKDVVWVPTPARLITRMLQMADTTARDLVVDLGSGDGRIPIAAARDFGARGLGVEFDPTLVELSIRSAAAAKVEDRVRFLRQDLFKADISAATVIALYVSPDVMTRLRPILLGLRPGTRVVSHQFTLGDWEHDEQAIVEGRNAYLWVVPAIVRGNWLLSSGGQTYELSLEQNHQMLHGTVRWALGQSQVFAGRLRGTEVHLSFIDANGDGRLFSGEVAGAAMRGSSSAYGGPELPWTARRP